MILAPYLARNLNVYASSFLFSNLLPHRIGFVIVSCTWCYCRNTVAITKAINMNYNQGKQNELSLRDSVLHSERSQDVMEKLCPPCRRVLQQLDKCPEGRAAFGNYLLLSRSILAMKYTNPAKNFCTQQ